MLNYDKGTQNLKNWIVSEDSFCEQNLGKTESIFCQGNGYIGLRASTEESYNNQIRNMFINGTFNKVDEDEVTELPNAADLLEMQIKINDAILDLKLGKVSFYNKELNLKNGELKREFRWQYNDLDITFSSSRFVSLANNRVVGQNIKLKNNSSKKINVEILSGINGQMTNSGAMHFNDGDKRLIEDLYLQMHTKTTESKIDFIYHLTHKFSRNTESLILMDRRKLLNRYRFSLSPSEQMQVEKLANVTTTRDFDYQLMKLDEIKLRALNEIKECYKKGFDQLLLESESIWENYWLENDVEIIGNDFDQLAIRFALYHMRVFTPFKDNRLNIGAKGLSGEGYKGHTFWDTEIFCLPPQIFTNPLVARNLLEYRYFGLSRARDKAKNNGFSGAQYPWESAWITDGEVTPVFGAADIVTGESTKIWSGFIEQHISADIAYAIWLYEKITDDEEFMRKMGYEMVFETATFWASRAEYNAKLDQYELNDVIGPNEYKEHINNDAFTNYMAKFNVDYAISLVERLSKSERKKLSEFINLKCWKEFSKKIYLPVANKNGIIAENDTFLSLKDIDLSKYKNQSNVGTIFEDFNLEQVNNMQVCKQADVLLLLLLKEELFTNETKTANWDYYESRTLHDSSLSLSTHAILANDMKNSKLADQLFKMACDIDLGQNPKTSDHGIHAASLAGIWQVVILGYSGVRMVENHLRILPNIKNDWKSLKYKLTYKNQKLIITATKSLLKIENTGQKDVLINTKDGQLKVKSGTIEIVGG